MMSVPWTLLVQDITNLPRLKGRTGLWVPPLSGRSVKEFVVSFSPPWNVMGDQYKGKQAEPQGHWGLSPGHQLILMCVGQADAEPSSPTHRSSCCNCPEALSRTPTPPTLYQALLGFLCVRGKLRSGCLHWSLLPHFFSSPVKPRPPCRTHSQFSSWALTRARKLPCL